MPVSYNLALRESNMQQAYIETLRVRYQHLAAARNSLMLAGEQTMAAKIGAMMFALHRQIKAIRFHGDEE